MTLDFTEDGIVKIDMREYVEKVLDKMPGEMDVTATTPAASHLFQMRSDAIILGNKKREFLHTTVAKLLFLCKRGRPDIQTAVAYLCTRVHEPTDGMDGTATTPAASHLSQMRSDAIILGDKKIEFLHTTAAKLLFLCKRGRPDIQTAVAFLCTRVRKPTSDDEKN